MILADTSVWVDHFRRRTIRLPALLEAGEVVCHPFVIGELACGNLRNREEILALLQALPQAAVVTQQDALGLIETRDLMGRGVGWVDVHLLAACLVTDAALWTLDRRLAAVARILGVGA